MTRPTVKEALAVMEATRNFMAGLTADPAVPEHAKEAIAKHIDALDRYIDGALEVPNGSATDDLKTPPLPAELRDAEPESRNYARAAVLADRERQRQKLPANWNHDSSLETWFPLTAETLRKLRAENAELRKDKARLDSGMIMTPERDEFGETFLCERRGMDLREAIDAAMAQENQK